MAKKTVKGLDLAKALEHELGLYHTDVTDRLNKLGRKAIKNLVDQTKATAPELTGSFKEHIASKRVTGTNGDRYVWYVKAPEYRLTHLLVHGHALPNGGRAKSDPFLKNAVDDVLPKYEAEIEEFLKK